MHPWQIRSGCERAGCDFGVGTRLLLVGEDRETSRGRELETLYFVDERFGYGTIEEFAGTAAERESLVRGELYRRCMKRPLDVVLATIGLVLLSPVFLAFAILVRLDSPGPVFFRQVRVGKDGRKFPFYKFRSMVRDAEEMKTNLMHLNELEGPVFKISEDPRVTRVGRFLRRTSIDELPQLWNVLRGDMSLVGPRPPLPGEVDKYESWQREKLSVLPGITCLWQISGRNHIGFTEWMRLDIEYIRRQSLGLDTKILVRTLPAVLSRKGAY
jgi:exopolysaccharide biosynthesis polyprenyl glycosylphosphotransferase